MKYTEDDMENKAIKIVASLMLAAAKTAPKERGINSLVSLVVDGKEQQALADEMRKIGSNTKQDYFLRDANGIEKASCVILLGATNKYHKVAHCGIYGVQNCGNAKRLGVMCAYNIGDLGIAIGSAVTVAKNHNIDNRIMFSAGKAAENLKYFTDDVTLIYAIPLSISEKNPFYDRPVATF